MRPGRKSGTISVNTKPIALRSCAVRIEKAKRVNESPVSTPTVVKISNSNNTSFQQKSLRSRRSATPPKHQQQQPQQQQQHVGEERKFRGPLKKRPITAISTPTLATTTSSKRDSISATPIKSVAKQQLQQHGSSKTTAVVIVKKKKQEPPTVAASRTRRAIKPNPKYTSEDMVTPRMIKNVANTSSGSISIAGKSEGTRSNVKRRNSSSSLEDFFSRESSVELTTEFDELVDKAFDDSDKDYNTDSESVTIGQDRQSQQQNTSNTGDTSGGITSSGPRKRGRPRREILQAVDSPVESNLSTRSLPKPALNKTNVIITKTRSGTPLIQKRKSIGGDKESTENELIVTRKRFLLSSSSITKKIKSLENDESKRTVHKTTQELNDNAGTTDDADDLPVEGDIMDVDDQNDIAENVNLSNRRKQQFNIKQKVLLKDNDVREIYSDEEKSPIVRKLDAQIKTTANNNSSSNINNNTIKRTSASKSLRTDPHINMTTTTTTATKRDSTNSNNNNNLKRSKFSQDSATNEGTDEDGMPCFTIVNINDIISKKGDAMVSKSSGESGGEIVIKSNTTARSSRSDSLNGRKEIEKTNYEKKIITKANTRPPQTILNHQLATRSQLTAKNKTSSAVVSMVKPAPRILNAMVAKKTQPVKPVTANPNDSADESLILSLDEEDEIEDNEQEKLNDSYPSGLTNFSLSEPEYENDDDDDDEENIEDDSNDVDFDPKKTKNTRQVNKRNSSYHNNNNKLSDKKRLIVTSTPSTSSSKENKLPKNQQHKNAVTGTGQEATNKLSRRLPPEKIEISRHGDKVIKKITCLENWYVITRNKQPPKSALVLQRSTLKMPIINLANIAVNVKLPSTQWNSKVTLYELPAAQLEKGTYTTYTGSLEEYTNINEEDRHKFQPSCVMFRRAVNQSEKSRLPYDRAVIFKNNTFFTNIDGKNVKLIAAPTVVQTQQDVEILLQIVDSLSLSSQHVELASSI